MFNKEVSCPGEPRNMLCRSLFEERVCRLDDVYQSLVAEGIRTFSKPREGSRSVLPRFNFGTSCSSLVHTACDTISRAVDVVFVSLVSKLLHDSTADFHVIFDERPNKFGVFIVFELHVLVLIASSEESNGPRFVLI